MRNKIGGIAFILIFLTSCIVQSPKYTTLAKVMSLETGMSKSEVEEKLGIKPYNLKGVTDTSRTFIYVYRVIDRNTLYFFTRPVNGHPIIGKYIQLEIAYNNDNKVIGISSCNLCPDNLVNTTRIDIEKILLFLTVTLPVLLVYFGLKK